MADVQDGKKKQTLCQDLLISLSPRQVVTELVDLTRAGVLAHVRPLVSAREVLFPVGFAQPLTGAAQVLFNGKEWRSWNLICKSAQPNSVETPNIQEGWDKMEGIAKSGRNIHELSENRGEPGTETTLLFRPCMGFFCCCHGDCQLSQRWWVCHSASLCITMSV